MLSENQAFLTPLQIVAELDKYIIGQHDAKRNVAIALRNRWRRMHAREDMKREIMPNNILMIGATGVGKTEIARRLAKIAAAPFVKVEASKFTEVGYVGRDVESMVRDLVEQSVKLVKLERKEAAKEKIEQLVEDQILDALIPPLRAGSDSDVQLNQETRERFRQKLKAGELEERKIDITVESSNMSGVGMISNAMDDVPVNFQEMLSDMLPKRSKKRKVSITDARRILFEEEANRVIDMDEVKEEAIARAENAGIIFIDEIDKIASSSRGGGGSPDVSREGVQRDLLPIVEGSAVSTKYGIINTDHVLFIAAGAFHVSKPSDLIPELQGRFPIRVELNSLTKDDFYRILKDPKNALTKQYEALLEAEQVELRFNDDALSEIADIAFYINSEVENIGARRLHTVMSQLLNEFLFDVPDKIGSNAKILITKDLVLEKLQKLVKNRDLSKYIL
ncbi:ATP-dependent protease ATPase subunit HslU [Hugenholtzia roseola]|uniref:ATP-dependent protease ATPase subunit HslU n=1 Tax=Hugenholtzia roseola TaxID=1002 RepID=UPI0003FA8989|nr:ATP-dependent protease ATPase subunit HslU [Hugenholtzia roseola]